MTIKAILAISDNYVIGVNDTLPWRSYDDMIHFKNSTKDQVLLIGSSTFIGMYQNLPKNTQHFLKNRKVLVLTRNVDSLIKKMTVIDSERSWLDGLDIDTSNLDVIDCSDKSSHDVLEIAKSYNTEHIFIGGGAKIYEDYLQHCDEILLTQIATNVVDGNCVVFSYLEEFLKHKQAEMRILHTFEKGDKNQFPGTIFEIKILKD